MSHLFPSLDALRPQLPKAEPSTEWVGSLAALAVPAGPAQGWTPPRFEPSMTQTVDLDAARMEATEEGFCAGYLAGQKAGVQRGLAEGRMQGREEGRQEVLEAEIAGLDAFRSALSEVVATVGPAVEERKAALEARIADLAMDAVRALLAVELATQRPDALGIVREALGHAEGAVRATIRLAPFDRASLAERKEEILSACASLRDVELVDDRSLEGGCVVETEQGLVDASLATRLALLEAA